LSSIKFKAMWNHFTTTQKHKEIILRLVTIQQEQWHINIILPNKCCGYALALFTACRLRWGYSTDV